MAYFSRVRSGIEIGKQTYLYKENKEAASRFNDLKNLA